MDFAIIDSYGEIIQTDSSSVITISAIESSAKVIGSTDVKVNSGLGIFKEITFIVPPGSENTF